jgi:hypothetical protein
VRFPQTKIGTFLVSTTGLRSKKHEKVRPVVGVFMPGRNVIQHMSNRQPNDEWE